MVKVARYNTALARFRDNPVRLQKKPVETTATNNYAETTSTEVKLHLKCAVFLSTTLKTAQQWNFFLSATV